MPPSASHRRSDIAPSRSSERDDHYDPVTAADVKAIFDAHCKRGSRARIRTPEGLVLPARLDAGRRLLVNWAPNAPALTPPFHIEVDGDYSEYVFAIDGVDAETGQLMDPRSAYRLRNRYYRRARAPRGISVAVRLGRRQVEYSVLEFSLLGFAFGCDKQRHLLEVGLTTDFELHWKAGQPRSVRGIVRHVSNRGGDWICGVQVYPEDAIAERFWQTDVAHVVYPQTTPASASDSDQLWELYANSGYLALSRKSPGQFESLRNAWIRAHEKLAHSDLVTRVIKRGPETMDGTLELCRFWSRASLGYHMARRQGDRAISQADNGTLRELHSHAYELAQRHLEVEWLVGYVQESARFSRLVHHDYPRRYVGSGRAAIVRFRAIEIPVETPTPAPSTDISVGAANGRELELALQRIAAMRPLPYVLAHDYTPSTFQMTSLIEQWGRTGVLRNRIMLIAQRRGRPVAAAILEMAEEGLHLYNMMDTVKIFSLSERGDDAIVPLLNAAQGWFAGWGKPKMIFMDERCTPMDGAWVSRGWNDLGLADCTVMSNTLVPGMLEFLAETTERIEEQSTESATSRRRGGKD